MQNLENPEREAVDNSMEKLRGAMTSLGGCNIKVWWQDTASVLREAEDRGAFSNRSHHNWALEKHRCVVEILEGDLDGMHASVCQVEGDEVSIHLWNSGGKPVRHVVDVSQVRVLDPEEAKAVRRRLNEANVKASGRANPEREAVDMEDRAYSPGDQITVFGLESEAGKAINGRCGEVVRYLPEKGRFEV